jgi:hypothetical protein
MARRLLGDRWFKVAGRGYRRLFVDLNDVIATLPQLPEKALVLDVGGGDGDLANLMARRFPTATFTLIDIAEHTGGWLDAATAEQVRVLPGTSIRDYAARGEATPDLVLVSDVVHHVPVAERPQFFADICSLNAAMVVVKEMEPHGVRSKLAAAADRYVSNDPASFVASDELARQLTDAFPGATVEPTALSKHDWPNYSLVVTMPPRRRSA